MELEIKKHIRPFWVLQSRHCFAGILRIAITNKRYLLFPRTVDINNECVCCLADTLIFLMSGKIIYILFSLYDGQNLHTCYI